MQAQNDRSIYFPFTIVLMLYQTMLVTQEERIVESMNILRKPQKAWKLFVAAEYWEGDKVTQRIALLLGYGVLYENGEDLSVHVSD
jgi:hypothetical protein